MYFPRLIEPIFRAYLQDFPAIFLMGPRQVGKSTFLAREMTEFRIFDLESPSLFQAIQDDPELFLKDHPQAIVLDEAQRWPALFDALRISLDRDPRPGRYILTGSASPLLNQRVSESLAGRIGLLTLRQISLREYLGAEKSDWLEVLNSMKTADQIFKWFGAHPKHAPRDAMNRHWFRGGYPDILLAESDSGAWRRQDSFFRFVVEKDIPMHASVPPARLNLLFKLLAHRHGQLFNASELGRELSLNYNTAQASVDLLEGTFHLYRLRPFFNNQSKRLVKSPKVYLTDSGLLHYLLGFRNHEDLLLSPYVGASWEGWVLQNLMADLDLLEPRPELYFWRTSAGAEVDLVIRHRGLLIPIEIKRKGTLGYRDVKGLAHFIEDHGSPFGLVLHGGEQLLRVSEKILAVPATWVLI